jgi:mono/diheme cytochrome c family protein
VRTPKPLLLLLVFAAIGCGQPTHNGEGALSSLAAACDASLKAAYQRTYYPFLSSTCVACHSGAQGSANVTTSYNAFMERGSSLIDYQATHAHGGNNLNPAVTQPIIDGFKPAWVAAQTQYLQCQVQAGGGAGGTKFITVDKAIPNLMNTVNNANSWVPVEFDLESESKVAAGNGAFKAIFRIEARVQVVNGQNKGVNFRNPSLRLKTGSQNVEIKTLSIEIDGNDQNLVTTYADVNTIVNQTTNTPLISNSGAAFAYYPAVTATTKAGFIFQHIKNTAQEPGAAGTAPNVPITPVPLPDVPPPEGGVTYSQLVSDNGVYRVFGRSCLGCHNNNNMSGALNLQSYDAAVAKAATISARINDAANPMPPSGLLRQNDRDLVQSWIDNGTKN